MHLLIFASKKRIPQIDHGNNMFPEAPHALAPVAFCLLSPRPSNSPALYTLSHAHPEAGGGEVVLASPAFSWLLLAGQATLLGHRPGPAASSAGQGHCALMATA